MKYVKNGEEFEFEFDFDLLEKYEREDPDFSVFSLMNAFAQKFRFTDAKKLTSLVGWDYMAFMEKFDINDITEIYAELITTLGFPKADISGTGSADA